jgi:carbon storage regulator
MLVLTRKVGERIVIDNNITVEVLEVNGNRVRIGIQAPDGVTILRKELLLRDTAGARGDANAVALS